MEATGAPEPSRSLPAADPSDELLEGVPEEPENQQKEAGQNSDHSGNGSGTQTGANVGDHFNKIGVSPLYWLFTEDTELRENSAFAQVYIFRRGVEVKLDAF